jgi:hypothetical protein
MQLKCYSWWHWKLLPYPACWAGTDQYLDVGTYWETKKHGEVWSLKRHRCSQDYSIYSCYITILLFVSHLLTTIVTSKVNHTGIYVSRFPGEQSRLSADRAPGWSRGTKKVQTACEG